MSIINSATIKNYKIDQLNTKSIRVYKINNQRIYQYVGDKKNISTLREIAKITQTDILNGNNNVKNTRTLGIDIIKKINAIKKWLFWLNQYR